MSRLTCSSVLAAVVGDHLLEQLAHPQDLVGLDLDVGGLAEGALGVGLVDQDPAVRQRQPLAGVPAASRIAAAEAAWPEADRLHVGLDELHRVVDRGQRGERAAGLLM